MYGKEFLEEIEKNVERWRKAHQAEIEEVEKNGHFTEDGISLSLPMKNIIIRIYLPVQIHFIRPAG